MSVISSPNALAPDEGHHRPLQDQRPGRRARAVVVMALAEVRPDGAVLPAGPEAFDAVFERVLPFLGAGEQIRPGGPARVVLELDERTAAHARSRVVAMVRAVTAVPAAGELQLEVGCGLVHGRGRAALASAATEAERALAHRDLVPRPDLASGRVLARRTRPLRWSTPAQAVLAGFLAWVAPFLALVALHQVGLDVSQQVYVALLVGLGFMALLQAAEAVRALVPVDLPSEPEGPAPAASALVVAYLPNEADTIVETIQTFLALEYAGPLQVVLAYNTPHDLPVEAELRDLAARDSRLVLVRVDGSTSKSQNINHALPLLTGHFVGIFDADHHPARGSFARAWRWIAQGADVVQGHCVIRNGEAAGVARLVATEFEQIYAVSHPGRQRLHGFGVFGGSNGYWTLEAVRATRFRTDFLTEDIEASIRAVRDGRRIVNDPGLLSRELAPTTWRGLGRQRLRWAQGWLQVSVRHAHAVSGRDGLPARQRAGLAVLLLWREVFPWISSLMWPLLAFFVWRDGGLQLGASVLWATTIWTALSGPVQVLVAWRLAAPEIRRRRSWWWTYGLATVLFFTEWKNMISRIAQLKQLAGEHQWVVTPRSVLVAAGAEEVSA